MTLCIKHTNTFKSKVTRCATSRGHVLHIISKLPQKKKKCCFFVLCDQSLYDIYVLRELKRAEQAALCFQIAPAVLSIQQSISAAQTTNT